MMGRTAILICLLVYFALSLEHLDVYPPVGQDEPWIAAAPYKMATEGVLGSDLFAGYYGVERHNYQHMPLFPLLQAALFRFTGVGVYQMRFLPVAFGALLLATTYLVGKQAGDTGTGVLAALLMLGLRLGAGHGETGIPLLDSGRINRYDIAVPVFGLLALWTFNRAEPRKQAGHGASLLVGLLIGLSALSHLYGIFWLPALWAIGFLRHGWRYVRHEAPYWMAAGIVLTLLPWLLFIAGGWEDFQGQMRFVADRVDLFNPHFYVDNVLHEIDRYRWLDLLDPNGQPYLKRPGAWLTILLLPVAHLVLTWRAHDPKVRRSAQAVAVAFVVQSLLFALLLKVKSENYFIGLWPLAVLVVAWLGMWVWHQRANRPLRGMLLALLTLVLLEGSGQIAGRRAVAAATTPYVQMTAQIAALIPPGTRVLGLPHFWLGLRAYPYRTWLLPLLYALPEYYTPALTLDEALSRVKPDVILIDYNMQVYFDELADVAHHNHHLYQGYRRYMDAHNARILGVVEDATYGKVTVYQVDKPALSSEPLPGAGTP